MLESGCRRRVEVFIDPHDETLFVESKNNAYVDPHLLAVFPSHADVMLLDHGAGSDDTAWVLVPEAVERFDETAHGGEQVPRVRFLARDVLDCPRMGADLLDRAFPISAHDRRKKLFGSCC